MTALGVVVALAVLAVGGLVIAETRQDAWTQASQASENLRLALTRDIARNLGVFDLSLRGVVRALGEPGLDQASPGVRRLALFDTSSSAEDLGSILVLDATGRIVEDSTSPEPHDAVLGDRDYFRIHRDRDDVGLFVSRPFRSRIAGGDPRIALTRRLTTPDGQFAGIVEGTLRLTFFDRLFSQLDIGPHGAITLIRDDGRVIARRPAREENVDKDLGQSAPFRRAVASDHGEFVASAAIDGVERLVTFGHVPGLPLILTVGRATEDILAPWRARTLLIAPVLLLLFSGAIASSLLFRREIGRRMAAEAMLRDSAREFAALATVDGLTGVPNRRAFEITLDTEWRRAIRDRTSPIALLMIDVDHFKLFNDRFGHPEGDRVLRAVATHLQTKIRRPGDIVARFGGEEFVAILPCTGLEGAREIAERMRAGVADLAIGNPGSATGRVTLSIGIAACRPHGGDASTELLAAADRALYAAKRDGRNRVRAGEVGERAA